MHSSFVAMSLMYTTSMGFQNYSLHHWSSLESVLKNINIRMKSGEKMGIIDSTGDGKSSFSKGIILQQYSI